MEVALPRQKIQTCHDMEPRSFVLGEQHRIPFFKTGPLAWNGIFAWWVPLCVYFCWFVVMVVLLLRAISDDERTQAQTNIADWLTGDKPELASPNLS